MLQRFLTTIYQERYLSLISEDISYFILEFLLITLKEFSSFFLMLQKTPPYSWELWWFPFEKELSFCVLEMSYSPLVPTSTKSDYLMRTCKFTNVNLLWVLPRSRLWNSNEWSHFSILFQISCLLMKKNRSSNMIRMVTSPVWSLHNMLSESGVLLRIFLYRHCKSLYHKTLFLLHLTL